MDRELLAAALRVLTDRLDNRRVAAEDVDLLRMHAIFRERDYELQDLAVARSIVQRLLTAKWTEHFLTAARLEDKARKP